MQSHYQLFSIYTPVPRSILFSPIVTTNFTNLYTLSQKFKDVSHKVTANFISDLSQCFLLWNGIVTLTSQIFFSAQEQGESSG
jgi:hypothetical protein